MNLLKMAQAYVRIQPNDEYAKDEYWETPLKRAESVLADFLRDQGQSVWKLTFIWIEKDLTRTSNHYFVLEETLDQYTKECEAGWRKSPNGPPTRIVKCLTEPK